MEPSDHDLEARLWYEEKLARLPAAKHWYTSITGAIILINIAVFLLMAVKFHAGWILTSNMDPYIRFAASNASVTTNGEWWRLLVAMFVHYGIIHIGTNMWALFNLGELMETLSGKFIYTLTYIACGLGGGFASMIYHGDKVWSAGASGAIFGILGATLGYILRQKKALPRSVYRPLLQSTLFFAAYNLFYGFAGESIDNANHVGGFITGIAIGWLTALPLELEVRRKLWPSRAIVALVALTVVIGVGYKFSPRFDHDLAEDYKFNQAYAAIDAGQPKLMRDYNAAVQAAQQTGDQGGVFEKFLQTKYLPFFQTQQKELAALRLTPGLRTDRRRNGLVKLAQTRIDAAAHLLKFRQNQDPQELRAYQDAERKVDEAVRTLPE
ncbi:MAG TPA: rhomboid family intramembrane serine protease [Opitutaceae bacterium]